MFNTVQQTYFAVTPSDSEGEHIPPEAASTYAKLAAAYGQDYYQSVAADVARHVTAGDRVLDAGTGPGFLPLAVADRTDGVCVDAFDYTHELVGYGRRNVSGRGLQETVSFFVADCYTIPATANSYDLLTCTGVLHSLEKPAAALTEFHRVLRQGTSAWVFDPAILAVPDDPDPRFTDHEREVFESYHGQATEAMLSAAEARQVVASTPFDSATVTEREEGDLRLYLEKAEDTNDD